MRSTLARSALALLASALFVSCSEMPIAPTRNTTSPNQSVVVTPPQIVISQIYGGGGNSGATLKNDFIELFNPGTDTVNVAGWSVQYASSTGNFTSVTAIGGKIAPGAYYLVQQAAGTGGTVDLPTPDATGTIAMAGGSGKVLVSRTTTALGVACPSGGNVVNQVSYGSGTNCRSFTPTLTNTTAALRGDSGCLYADSAAADFTTGAPAPRNSASAKHVCDNNNNQPVVATVEVTPDTATIFIAATKAFTATARDSANNVMPSATFTWSSSNSAVATVDASGVATGVAQGSAKIIATSSNGRADSATLTVNTPPPPVIADIVISQVYGGGGNSGAFWRNDYIELFNRGTDPIDLTGWTVNYTNSTGSSWQSTTLSGTLQPKKYYLVQEAAGASTTATPLPTPDASGGIAMSGTSAKVVLAQPGATVSGACPAGAGIMDRIAYGNNSNGCDAQWGGHTPDLSNTNAAFRKRDGCISTGSASDFVVQLANPRNNASPAKNCTQPSRPASTATIVINELMGDPANAESASWGEWFEVRNTGASPVNLQGWTIISDGTSQPDHTITQSVVVPAGGYVVLGRGDDITRNGGVALDYNYFTGNATTIWLDDADFLMLVDNVGALVDSVAWTSLPRGVSKGVRDAAQPNADVDGANWGYSNTTFGDGDYGTPGADNDPLLNTPPFVSPNTITVSGRVATDAPLPVGFEAQLFATERDASNAVITTTFKWKALTPAIASVDSLTGVIHALAPGLARFRVTAADGAARNHNLLMETPVASTTAQYLNNAEFGEPTDNDSTDDFILRRAQYTTSWNGARGIPNWVAYDLNGTHITPGNDRCNCFTFDPELEQAGFTKYTTADYTGAGAFAGYGIDRGHMTRSFDRTSGTLDNARTFYFSNVVPQAARLNQGPWAVLENFLGAKAQTDNKEVYVIVGPAGSKGTVKDEGKITIPQYVWKVALIMDRGKGLADVRDYRDVEVIAVVAPNDSMINGVSMANIDWHSFVVTVDSVEALTGYDLLALLQDNVERAVESNTKPPLGAVDGPYTGVEGTTSIAMSGAASIDPNGTIVSYAWDFGDGTTGSGANVTHTYAQDGTFTVRLVVTDNDALVDTVTTTATVSNVAPSVGSFSGATLLPKETYSASGLFTDPGAETWSATANYGDGSGTNALSLSGKDFSLSHQYVTPGTFTVTVTVADDDTTASQTATVVVWTLAQALDSADALVAPLLAAGKVTPSAVNNLVTARKQIQDNKPQNAVAPLQNLLSNLSIWVSSGKLTAAEAEPLRSIVQRLVDAL